MSVSKWNSAQAMSTLDYIEYTPPSFTIDLDLPPSKRWCHVVQAMKPAIKRLAEDIPRIIRKEFGNVVGLFHRPVIRPLCYVKRIPSQYSKEIQGIAQEMNRVVGNNHRRKITYADLVLFNVALDFLARCTSIVACTRDGQILARTLDWDWPLLRDLTIVVKFRRGGTTLFEGVTFIGCVGLLTAMRYSNGATEIRSQTGFALSYNFRKTLTASSSYCSMLRHVTRTYFENNHACFILRHVVTVCKSYDDAYALLSKIPLASTGYITLAGIKINEGAVFAKGSSEYIKIMTGTCIVQTNHDDRMTTISADWAGDDPILQSTIERRAVAEFGLQGNGTLSIGDVEKCMYRNPIHNRSTVFTCFMTPAGNRLHCVLDATAV